MGRPKYKTKPDANHGVVRDWLVAMGCEAIGLHPVTYAGGEFLGFDVMGMDLKDVGGAVTDWVVWVGRIVVFLEVKQDDSHALTQAEAMFFQRVPGWAFVVHSVMDIDDVMRSVVLYHKGGGL